MRSRITLPAFAAKPRVSDAAPSSTHTGPQPEELVTYWSLPVLPIVILCCSRDVCVLLLRYLVRHEELSSNRRLYRDLKSSYPPLTVCE